MQELLQVEVDGKPHPLTGSRNLKKCLEMWCPLTQLFLTYMSMVRENACVVLVDGWGIIYE